MLDQPTGWTPEREQKLRELWPETTVSCERIATMLGGGLTKGAVTGKAHKLNLPLRQKPARRSPVAMPARSVAIEAGPIKSGNPRGVPSTSDIGVSNVCSRRPEAWEPLPGTTPVPYEIATGCRWQYGDGHGPKNPTCNEPVHHRSFCQAHFDIAYPKGFEPK